MEADFDSADDLLHPIWLDRPRGFVDRRTEEAEAFNDVLTQHLVSSIRDWTCDMDGWTFELTDVTVKVCNDELEPLKANALSNTMPRKYLDELRLELRDLLQEPSDLQWSSIGFAVLLLQLVEEAVVWQRAWKTRMAQRLRKDRWVTDVPGAEIDQWQPWNAREVRGWTSVLDNPYGVNLSTIEDTAQHILGESITDICSRFPECLRILHAEPVFRDDLVQRFRLMQRRMFWRLLELPYEALRECVSPKTIRPGSADDHKKALAEELLQPLVTFHGAPRRVIESIVRYGFIIPGEDIGGTGAKLDVRCGSSFGVGVYSSPDPLYASMYGGYQRHETGQDVLQPGDVPGYKLIVCATIMGRAMRVSRKEAWRKSEILSNEAHSHISPDQMEYIVFQSAQIIPCYVVHIDYGAVAARKEFERIARNPVDYFQRQNKQRTVNKWVDNAPLCPGDQQRKSAALKAAATKWFPYGYGAAEGTSFVIEDMAEVSDDEETYGQFQLQRIEKDTEIREREERHMNVGESWFDEYQTVRKMKLDVKRAYDSDSDW